MQQPSDASYILSFAKKFFAGTLLSRISGGVRDVAMAICFGGSPEIGAFMVAYRLTYLMRRVLGEGNLQAGFVPHFEALQKEGEHRSLALFRDSFYSLSVVLIGLILLLEAGLWTLGLCLSSDWREIVELSMWMAPGLLFICLYALNGAFLQCQKSYFPFAVAPVFFNCVWIACSFFFRSWPLVDAVRYLAIGTTLACALQWGFTAFSAFSYLKMPWRTWFRPSLFSSDWKKLIKPLMLGLVGVGATQVNSALDAIFARVSDLSGPAYLWYAIRFQQLPLALFGIALSGASLAPLSRALQREDWELYRNLLQRVLSHSIVLLVPCMFAFFALGGPILNAFYGHGDFQSHDIRETLYCLWGYAIGLLPSAFVLILATGLYAHRSYQAPALASMASVAFNIFLNTVMVFFLHLGAFSIALGTSIAALLNCFLLIHFIGKKAGGFHCFRGLLAPFGKVTCLSCIATLATFWVESFLFKGEFTRNLSEQWIQLGVLGMVFLLILGIGGYRTRLIRFEL